MRVTEVLELAEQSTNSLTARIEDLSIKDLYDLTADLRLFNNPEIFKTCHKILLDKLRSLLQGIQGLEVGKEKGYERLCYHIKEKTGLYVSSDTLPDAALEKFINEIISWAE